MFEGTGRAVSRTASSGKHPDYSFFAASLSCLSSYHILQHLKKSKKWHHRRRSEISIPMLKSVDAYAEPIRKLPQLTIKVKNNKNNS
jgi:hypothetical protein